MSDVEARFWSHVSIGDGCWLWRGGVNGTSGKGTGGYGYFNGRRAHRVSFELAHGPIQDGMVVMHACDTRRCVRPTHLRLGTHAENMADMKAKGRQATGDRHASRLHPELVLQRSEKIRGDGHPLRRNPGAAARGTGHGCAVLDDEKVREIRARAAAGEMYEKIASDFSISTSNVGMIARRVTWRHVP